MDMPAGTERLDEAVARALAVPGARVPVLITCAAACGPLAERLAGAGIEVGEPIEFGHQPEPGAPPIGAGGVLPATIAAEDVVGLLADPDVVRIELDEEATAL